MPYTTLDIGDLRSLAEVRYQIRLFLHFSEQAARRAGLEPQQHQFLLALKGLPAGRKPSVRELADRMQLRHHSAVELANRLEARGFLKRSRSDEDRREVLLALSPKAERLLMRLSLDHRTELLRQGPLLMNALRRVMRPRKLSTKSKNRKSHESN